MSITIIKKTGKHGMYSGARTIRYIVIHYTAGVTSKSGSARATAAWFANPSARGTADFIVDDEETVQYNPDPRYYACWAVGGGKISDKGGKLYGIATNKNSVSIEICSTNRAGKVTTPNDANWSFTDKAVARAVELTKYLMQLYNVPATRVIRHYDVTGKLCPGIRGWNADSESETAWNNFKKQISSTSTSTSGSASATAASGSTTKIKWVVTVADLRIRKGPGASYDWTGKYTGKGTFTITEQKNGFGRLKSGAGWISLDTRYGHKA